MNPPIIIASFAIPFNMVVVFVFASVSNIFFNPPKKPSPLFSEPPFENLPNSEVIDFIPLNALNAIGKPTNAPIKILTAVAFSLKNSPIFLKKFPKVGEKVARQIILDLKGKLAIDTSEITSNGFEELISVLEGLGYKQADIKKILPNVDASKTIENQVKEALRLLLK